MGHSPLSWVCSPHASGRATSWEEVDVFDAERRPRGVVDTCNAARRWSPPAQSLLGSRYTKVSSGFTLIEILVVVALLGIIAAIVLLNITGFMGSGSVESANVEAHQVQTAVIAYMEASGLRPGDMAETVVDKDGPPEVAQYILNSSRLQAKYTITDGVISDAYPYPDGKWANCTWDAERCEWLIIDD
ncbi:MAG: type II secretion system protein [Dehalococcoidia bacterium]|nr:type II secretion system protein [Dehalococcoidia bacterium]